jgi:hypothetical protein
MLFYFIGVKLIIKSKKMGIGDWGLGIGGIGDWAQNPIPKTPNPKPQTPNPKTKNQNLNKKLKK